MGLVWISVSLSVCLFSIVEANFIGFRPPVVPIALPLPLPIVRPMPIPFFKKGGYYKGRRMGGGRPVAPVTKVSTGVRTRNIGQRVDRGRDLNRGSEVIVIVNERDCFGGICGGMGGGPMVGGGGPAIGGPIGRMDGLGSGVIIGGGLNRFPDSIDTGSFIDYRDIDMRGGIQGRRVNPRGRSGSYSIHDADTVVIGGNGQY